MNAPQTAQSLLSLPPGVSTPDPYAVLGLTTGESDNARIAAALKSVVVRLNGVKASADPAAWNQAATWVKEARRVLSNPELKAQLDQQAVGRNGNAAIEPKFDPLAGFLPGQATAAQPSGGLLQPVPGRPVAANAGTTAFRAGIVPPSPPPPPPQPQPPAVAPPTGPLSTTVAENAGQAWPQIAVGGVALEAARELEAIGKPKTPGRRRKKRFPWASLVLVGLTVASIGGMVAIMIYLNKNPGGITIALQPGANGATPVAGSDFAVAPPAERDDSPVDPVMGRLSPAKPERNAGRDSTGEAADDWLADLPHSGPPENMPNSDGAMATETPTMTDIPDQSAPAMEAPNMATVPGTTEPTPEQLETAQSALQKAREVLAAADWDQMNPAAIAALKVAVTDEQKRMAEQLVQLADLATYYHIGVEKAINELKANETFDVTEQLQVSVVEITPAKVILRFNGRNKDYARSELPLVVAHKLAGFTMPVDTPATKTAAQAYQALAPVTTPQYRDLAIKNLEAIPQQPDDVDPADLVAAIRQVFPE